MDLFTYLMAKKGQNTQRDLFSYLLGKGAGGIGTYVNFTGTSLNISNTLRARIKNITLKGATSQHTTTGKNKLPLASGTVTHFPGSNNKYSTLTIEDNIIHDVGYVTEGATGEFTSRYKISVVLADANYLDFLPTSDLFTLPAGTYSLNYIYLSGVYSNTNSTNNNRSISISKVKDGTKTIIATINNLQNVNRSVSFILEEDSELSCAYGEYVSSNNISNVNIDTYFKVTITPGKTADYDFEEYTGGNPSPSPDYPQPIKVVTGEQNVKLIGKNLFDKDNINKFNGYFDSKSQIRTSNYNRIFYIRCKSNSTYTISQGSSTLSNHVLQVATSNVVPTVDVICTPYHEIGTSTSYTLTTDSVAKYLVFRIRSGDDVATYWETIQIEEGSTATSYTPYYSKDYPLSLGTLELAKIGDYQDYIYGTPNNWYKKSAITKINLSTLTWVLRDWGYRADADLSNIVTPSNTNIMAILLCNVYGACTPNNAYGLTGSLEHGISVYNNMILVREAIIRDLNDFNTMISSAYAYLVNIEPTDTQITDTTLITQLNNLYNATSQEGTTIITCSSASDSNEIIVFSGDIKVASVGLGNPLNTSLLSSNIQEEPNLDDVNETEDIEQNEEPIEEEVS